MNERLLKVMRVGDNELMHEKKLSDLKVKHLDQTKPGNQEEIKENSRQYREHTKVQVKDSES